MIKLSIILFTLSLGLCSAAKFEGPDFFFYSQLAPNNHINVNAGLNGVAGFDPSRETKFLIHGFSDAYNGVRVAKVRAALVQNTNANIIVVDWSKGAPMPWYLDAVDNTRVVGLKTAEFILANNLNPKNVHCIGHSLGAHTCGFVGKHVKLGRISGLDPAGPWFTSNPAHERLDKSDADFVDCIHTDSMCGIQKPICHKDYYPNGGATMAGCGVTSILNIFGKKKRSVDKMALEDAKWAVTHEDDDTKVVFYFSFVHEDDPRSKFLDMAEVAACSHLRVMHYFAESLTHSCPFTSTECHDYSAWKKGSCKCASSGCSSMGINADRNKENGLFFLDTNKYSLYCKN